MGLIPKKRYESYVNRLKDLLEGCVIEVVCGDLFVDAFIPCEVDCEPSVESFLVANLDALESDEDDK